MYNSLSVCISAVYYTYIVYTPGTMRLNADAKFTITMVYAYA